MKELNSTVALRKNNKNRIYRYIYSSQGKATKQDIASAIELSLPTVTQNLQELMEAGAIKYEGNSPSTGGRKARIITVNAKIKLSIGLSISADRVRIVCIDLKSNVLFYKKVSTLFENSHDYYRKTAEFLETFIEENKIQRDKVLGVGITFPGIIDEENNEVIFAPTLSSEKISLAYLKSIISFDVRIINDAVASGYAENRGNEKSGNLAYLFIERGVGGAIFVNDNAYFGDNGRSAEFGHMCVVPQGKKCDCGQNGCLEAYCSIARISDDLGMTLEEFFEELSLKNEKMQNLWDEYLFYLAHAIVNISTMLDCQVVLGGMLAPFMEQYFEKLMQYVSSFTSFGKERQSVRLCKYKARSTCIGSALSFVDRYIETI